MSSQQKEKKTKKRRGAKRTRASRAENKQKKSQLVGTGAHGIDPTAQSSAPRNIVSESVMSPGSIDTLSVVVDVQDRSISYLAMGIVLKALQRGSATVGIDVGAPYYQFRYLIEVFRSMMLSSTPLLTVAPKWMWELLYALKPKKGFFKTGFVNYTWNILDSGLGDDQVFNLGANSPGATDLYTVFWGNAPSPSSVNGFPVLGPLPPYSTPLGVSAISALWPYVTLQNEALIADPGPTGVCTSNDTSAFAVVYPELGSSYFSNGAVRTTTYSERVMDSPMLTQFGIYQEQGTSAWRGWQHARVGCGSPSYIGPRLIDTITNKVGIRNKGISVLKYYNFDEFYEQLGLTMSLAMEMLNRSQGQVVTQCPLNPIEVNLLLRQAILQVCSNEYAQDVRYTGLNYVDLLPFTVGPNGTTGGAPVPMLLPTFLAENIRCIAAISTKTSARYPLSVSWYPILARPRETGTAQLSNYQWDAGQYVYDTSPYQYVDVIDVSTAVGQDTVYLDLTRVEMSILCSKWNEWITRYTAVLSPLVTITAERGIRQINCNFVTQIQEAQTFTPQLTTQPAIAKGGNVQQQATAMITNTTTHTLQKKASGKGFAVGSSINRFVTGQDPVPDNTYFHQIGDKKITSVTGFNKVLDQIMDSFILPVNLAIDSVEDASTQGYQGFVCEPASKPRSTGNSFAGLYPGSPFLGFPTAYERHSRAAAYDIKQFATTDQQNEIIQALHEMARQGRGGFLSSTLAGIANAFFPGTGKFVEKAGDSLGI